MKKEDLRVQKTKNAIRGAFIELVEQKGYKKVTVSDIVSKANINRNTFYLHYQDKEDLIEQVISELSKKTIAAFDSFYKDRKTTLHLINEAQIRVWFRFFLHISKPDVELYRVIMVDQSLRGYILFLYDTIKKHLQDLLNIKNARSNIVFEYSFNGMVGVFNQWVTYSIINDNQTTKILAHLAYESLRTFKDINDE